MRAGWRAIVFSASRRTRPPTGRRAFSVAELVVALTIAGALLVLAMPRISVMRDRAATHSASADLSAMFATARQLAITRRTFVSLFLDGAHASAQLHSDGRTLMRHELGVMYGVSLAATRDSSVYDARGFGYGVSNLTVIVRRGRAVDTLVVSRLGRVRSVW